MYIVLSINDNFTGDLRNVPASLRPHWEHFEIDSFSLLFLATTDLEFMAPHSSTLAWKIPWMEEPGVLQSMGSLRVGHNWATSLWLFTLMHWRRKWQPTPVFLPWGSQGQGSLVGYSPWGHEESDMSERLDFHFSLSCIGERNGNPLQCSCLENPRDGGAWWAAVYGISQSQTQLKRLSSSNSRSRIYLFFIYTFWSFKNRSIEGILWWTHGYLPLSSSLCQWNWIWYCLSCLTLV